MADVLEDAFLANCADEDSVVCVVRRQMKASYHLWLLMTTRRTRTKHRRWNSAPYFFSYQESEDEVFPPTIISESKKFWLPPLGTQARPHAITAHGSFKHRRVDMPYCYAIAVYSCYSSLSIGQLSLIQTDVPLRFELTSFCCILVRQKLQPSQASYPPRCINFFAIMTPLICHKSSTVYARANAQFQKKDSA